MVSAVGIDPYPLQTLCFSGPGHTVHTLGRVSWLVAHALVASLRSCVSVDAIDDEEKAGMNSRLASMYLKVRLSLFIRIEH